MSVTVDYYLSPMSPWTYLGHRRFAEILAKHNASVNVKPFDVARVFSVSGGLPLKQRAPQRQAYRMMELKRWREFLDVPLTLEPTFFPYATEAASMLIIAAEQIFGSEKAMELTGAILKGCWADERNCADNETLGQLAASVGLNIQTLRANDPQARQIYERYTAEATERQVFGAPTYVVNDELFWGQDRLDFVERAVARVR